MFFEYDLGELFRLLPKLVIVFDDGRIAGATKFGYFLIAWSIVFMSILYSLRKERVDLEGVSYTKLTRIRDSAFYSFVLCVVGLLVLFVVDLLLFGLYKILL